LGHPCKFQRVSLLGTVTAQHSSSGRQPIFAALNRGCHLYSAGRISRWALAHISSFFKFLPAKDLAPFSIHYIPHKKLSFNLINDQFIVAMLSIAKSANVGFSQVTVVQLFARPTNPPFGPVHKIPFINSEKNFRSVSNVPQILGFSRVRVSIRVSLV